MGSRDPVSNPSHPHVYSQYATGPGTTGRMVLSTYIIITGWRREMVTFEIIRKKRRKLTKL
jgi:hypothetical protein